MQAGPIVHTDGINLYAYVGGVPVDFLTGWIGVFMNKLSGSCAAPLSILAVFFVLFGCCDQGESDSVYIPSVCQMKFYKGGRAADEEINRFMIYLEENRENLVHRPYLLGDNIYVKGDCYFLQREIYMENRWTLRSASEYNDWPFDPD